MAEIVERLRRTKEQIGSVSSVLLDIVNAGDQISRVLKIGCRPALFQDLRDKWVSVSDMESAIGTGIDTIEQRDQIIAGLLEAAKPFVRFPKLAENENWDDDDANAVLIGSGVTIGHFRALSEAASKARAVMEGK